jgi:hypothetical protein
VIKSSVRSVNERGRKPVRRDSDEGFETRPCLFRLTSGKICGKVYTLGRTDDNERGYMREEREKAYIAAVDKLKESEQDRIMAFLCAIADIGDKSGFMCPDGVQDLSGDDYMWGITLEDVDSAEIFWIDVEITESLSYEGTTEGVSFIVRITDEEGYELGQIAPYNYTKDVWVDVWDAAAVAERFGILDDISGNNIIDYILTHRK